MEKSEQTKASQHVDGADRLSSFPDPVLHLILSGLPTTEEVIRTSILSRRWRYLWTSVPSIDLDYSRGPNSKPNFKRNKFKEFVYCVLLSRSLDLDSFHLTCYNLYNMSTVRRWIHAAVTRNVKQLHLMFLPGKEEKIEMPHCLVTCDSLEELKLSTSRLSLPNFTGFPSLRVLQLNGVEFFDSDLVKAFFKSCPVLEELSLIDCTIDELKVLCISCLKLKNLIIDNRVMIPEGAFSVCGNLHIACPKLVYLELIGPMAYKYSFDGLDSLKKAVIFPEYLDRASLEDELEIEHDPDPQLYINTLHEFFSGISHVESLSISISFAYECMKPEVDVAASLPNLKTLELTVDHMTKNAVKFIKYFPDLESLHLNIFSQYNPLQYWKLDDTATMRILTRQLKKVEYFDFGGRSDELEVASFFLEHGNALEEMVFKWSDKAMFNDKSNETMNEISNFHKASSTVKLIALYKYRSDGYSYDLYKYHIDSHLW